MIKKILLAAAVAFLISGCTDKKEENKDNKEVSQTQAPLKIEVEENKNAKEIKVADKLNHETSEKSYYMDYGVKSEYDPNSQPANSDASVRVKPRTNIDANMHVRSPYEKIKISLLVKKLSKEFIVKCSACHNDYANGIIGPSLLDKDSDFIFNKIMKFKGDKDANVLMTGLVNQMNEKEIRKIADEIYEFNKQIRDIK
ncbi:c-type cytochrome [Halarcobacter ebronensis]|uniref:Cytochrome c domain-containing protein n=1 Tax=Halarcobacter ebronensis TaxID=1462615 RepID=A0A4Q1AQ51_9BACT|nr:hypothetical protein [Halarcobacter ebronensis]QKF82808.1 monoheme c-type cytochrome [Halarcobacter ebronensis]RXK06832.1 hypothetical protein CRV07_05210 [Halarcobacter ebronensis]